MIVESMISTVAEWTRNVVRDDELVDASLLAVLSLLLPHLTESLEMPVRARIRALSEKLGSNKTKPAKSARKPKAELSKLQQ